MGSTHRIFAIESLLKVAFLSRDKVRVFFDEAALVFMRGAKPELFAELAMDLTHFLALLLLFEFEFAAHLVHRVADDAVFDQTALLVFAHFN